jgi:hypothetical protein
MSAAASSSGNLTVTSNANGSHTVAISDITVIRASRGYLFESTVTFDDGKAPALLVQSNRGEFRFCAYDKPYVVLLFLKNVQTQAKQIVGGKSISLSSC